MNIFEDFLDSFARVFSSAMKIIADFVIRYKNILISMLVAIIVSVILNVIIDMIESKRGDKK